MKRLDVRRILRDPALRKVMLSRVIRATQARESIDTTQEQAEAAYDKALNRAPTIPISGS